MWLYIDVALHWSGFTLIWFYIDLALHWSGFTLMWLYIDVALHWCGFALMWLYIDVSLYQVTPTCIFVCWGLQPCTGWVMISWKRTHFYNRDVRISYTLQPASLINTTLSSMTKRLEFCRWLHFLFLSEVNLMLIRVIFQAYFFCVG